MFGDSHTTEAAWVSDFKSNLCGYASRAVLTEFGVPMNTGVNYNGPRDGTNDLSYLYAITDTVRSLGMGSVLWTGVKQATQTAGPGPCENASCAITTLNGSGTNLSLSVTNQSGLDRLQWGWGIGSNPGGGGGGGTTACCAAPARTGAWTCPNASTANGTPARDLGLQRRHQPAVDLTSSKANCRSTATSAWTPPARGTAAGTKVDIWDCNGGANQQWNLNTDGTVIGRAVRPVPGRHRRRHRQRRLGRDLWTCTGGSNQKWTRQ